MLFLGLAFSIAVQAQDSKPAKEDTKAIQVDVAGSQERLKQQFKDFTTDLLRLAQRLENSPKTEDRDKAQALKNALKAASEQGIEVKFTTLILALKTSNAFKNIDTLQGVLTQNQEIRDDLRKLIDVLLKDDRESALRKEREEVQKLLEKLKEVIEKQERVQANTELGKLGKTDIAKAQNKVTKETKDLIDPKKAGDSKDGKDSKGKDSKDGKGGDPKDGKDGKDSKDGKGGDPKDGKDGKDSKDGKGGDPKDGKDGKDSKDGKGGDPKDGKDGKDSKGGDPKDGKGKDSKGGDPKDGKGKDSKGGDPKDGKGKDSKGGGEPKDGKGGDPMDGKSGESADMPPNPETQIAKKQIQEGIKEQEAAEKKIEKDDKKGASEDQAKAVDVLKQAQKKLEELLKQLREEEIERLLAQLQGRCEKMLAMQIAVKDGTVALDKIIMGNPDKKSSRNEDQKALELSDKEDEISKEANKALSLIEAEGSAVAFAEVFKQVIGDMNTAAGRLRRADVGDVTVAIENDIIDALKEMVEALKKARKDNQQPKPPMPPMPPQSGGQPPDQKLIDMIAELKMIRSMQIRVNNRTTIYGKQIQGEQVPNITKVADAKEKEKLAGVRKEFKDLSTRQQKLSKVTEDIAKGRNKGQ
ncbi:hypothetical protein EBX93_08700 [bacterium]|nr:hypothetical protein [bacterium]